MKISVIIPTYNRERSIARTLNSLRESDQMDVEIIVVDDASEDQTAKTVEALKIPNLILVKLARKTLKRVAVLLVLSTLVTVLFRSEPSCQSRP